MDLRPAISATGLRKSYGDQVVLDGIDLTVQAGTVFALLGPNGSGKTTTVNIMSTLIDADSGTVQVDGHDILSGAEDVRHAVPRQGGRARRPYRAAGPRPDRRRGQPAELKLLVPGGHLRVDFADEQALNAAAAAHPDAIRDLDTLTLRIPNDGAPRSTRTVLDGLHEEAVVGVSVHTPDLDDVFLALTEGDSATDVATVKEPAR